MAVPLVFHCDETSHKGHRFAAVGGIACTPTRLPMINDEIQRLQTAAGYQSEIKWEKVSVKYYDFFSDLVSYFFSLMQANHAHFHVLICDFKEYDHKRDNEGKRETSVSKSYYQLGLHRLCRLYGHKCDIHLIPDGGDCTAQLPNYIGHMNSESFSRWGCKPIRSIKPLRDSRSVPIIGLNDLIIGAIGAHKNGRHLRPDASKHKTDMADLIKGKFGLPHYDQDTSFENHPRWTVWNWECQPEPAWKRVRL